MSFALGVIPVVLLLLGFPIFLVLLTGVTVALVWYMKVPLAALHQTHKLTHGQCFAPQHQS